MATTHTKHAFKGETIDESSFERGPWTWA